jgi:hypothetical protein
VRTALLALLIVSFLALAAYDLAVGDIRTGLATLLLAVVNLLLL